MTKKSILFLFPLILIIVIFAVPLFVSAQIVPEVCRGEIFSADGTTNQCGFCALIQLVRNVINFIVLFLIVPLAAIAFAIAGIIYITAVGNPGKVKQAHDIFAYAFWGLILTLLAWLIVSALAITFLNPAVFPNGVFGFNCSGAEVQPQYVTPPGGPGFPGAGAPPPPQDPQPPVASVQCEALLLGNSCIITGDQVDACEAAAGCSISASPPLLCICSSPTPLIPPILTPQTPTVGVQCLEPLTGNSCIIDGNQIDACNDNSSNAACSVLVQQRTDGTIGSDITCRCGNTSPLIPPGDTTQPAPAPAPQPAPDPEPTPTPAPDPIPSPPPQDPLGCSEFPVGGCTTTNLEDVDACQEISCSPNNGICDCSVNIPPPPAPPATP